MIQATPTSISVVTDCSMRLCFVYGCDYYGYGYFTSSIFFRAENAGSVHSLSLACSFTSGRAFAPHTHGGLPNEGCVHTCGHAPPNEPHTQTQHTAAVTCASAARITHEGQAVCARMAGRAALGGGRVHT